MPIIYLHGLDSDPNATKAQITAEHARLFGIDTHRPNLNCPPADALEKILTLIKEYPDSVLIGSSLGGYFATLASDLTGTPAILLNPSIRPDVSFRRFLADKHAGKSLDDDTVIYTTTGGWQIVYQDLAWFESHRLCAKHANKIRVLLKAGDELLDAHLSHDFYKNAGASVLLQDGGDHRISDYDTLIPTILNWVNDLSA